MLLRAEIEPTYAKAHAVLGWGGLWAALCYWLPTREGYRQAELHAKNALSFDTAEPWSRMMLGLCLSTASYHQQALGELQAALELNSNFALGRTLLGWALLRAGSYDAAIAETGKPLRMSPMDSFAGIDTRSMVSPCSVPADSPTRCHICAPRSPPSLNTRAITTP